MTKDEIIRMAREAKQYAEYVTPQGLEWFDIYNERFAALVASAEREACAKVAESIAKDMTDLAQWGATQCANSIRKRGQA